MPIYKDAEDYEIEEKLAKRAKRIKEDKRKRIISALLAFNIVCNVLGTTAITTKYKFIHKNPFDGCSANFDDFNFNYKASKTMSILEDENYKDCVEYIKNMDIDKKKAYALYYAIIKNDDFKEDEKKALSSYINYAIDNKYLNYEKIYNSFISLSIKRNMRLDKNILGQYDGNNEIRLSSKATFSTLFHELCHSDKNNNLPLWFEEGITELISNEYFEEKTGVYALNKNVIRILCEILGRENGTDILFKIEGTGNFNILTDELINKGINKELCEELYETLDKYHINQINNKLNTNESEKLKTKIKGILALMYNISYNNPKHTNGVVDILFYNVDINLKEYKFYYLNQEKQKKYKNFYQIRYYYPLNLYYEEINDDINLKERQEINDENYVRLNDSELKKCDQSKTIKFITYFNDDVTNTYISKNNHDTILFKSNENNKNIIDHYMNIYESEKENNIKK